MFSELIALKDIEQSRFSTKQKRIFTVIAIILILLFCGLITLLVGKPLIEYLNDPHKFKVFVKEHGILSDIVFILMIVFQMIIAFIPGEPFEIAAGYAFHPIRGTVDCLIGFALGGTIVFLFVRKFGVKIVEVFFPIEKIRELRFLQNSKRLNTVSFIFFLIPGTPKDLLTYFIGLTDMKLSVWLIITTVARLPSLISSIVTGHALSNQRYETVIIIIAVTLVVSAIGLIIYKKMKKDDKS